LQNMATNFDRLDIALVTALVGGVGFFFRGVRAYREFLRVQGTPTMPIRGISTGLVRIHGKPTSEHLLNSPISHTPCCFYKVDIDKWRDGDEDGTWLHYGSEADGVRFYLEDSTGRVLVDARGAEFDLERSVMREVANGITSNVAASGASDAELLEYAARVGPSPEEPGTRHNFEGERAQLAIGKYLRHPTTPDQLFQAMVGPQVAQIRERLEAEGPQSDPLREEIRLAQIELYTHPFWSPEYAEGFKHVTKLQEQYRRERARSGASQPLQALPSSRQSPTPEYRFTECCILPDHEYDITGTCGENPEPKDVNDHKLIRKGPHEPTYLISSLARADVNVMLQMRWQLLMFGGGMLAVFCLGLLLLRFGPF
jgi:hypothetical protein